MRPQETSAIFIHPLLETFSKAVVCEKMLAVCDHAELQLVRKRGFSPQLLSDSVAYVGLNTGKRSQ